MVVVEEPCLKSNGPNSSAVQGMVPLDSDGWQLRRVRAADANVEPQLGALHSVAGAGATQTVRDH
eukprot:588306-Prorocentrum_minimum.AAC.3